MSIGTKINRECIVNEVRMKLVVLDHSGIPAEPEKDEDPRDTLLMMAALAIYAVEEIDAKAKL
jgi:hypothetical protein